MQDFLSTAIGHSNEKEFFHKFILFQEEHIGTCKNCNQQQVTGISLQRSYIKLHNTHVLKRTPSVKAMIEDYFNFQSRSDKLNCKGCKKNVTIDGLSQFHGKFSYLLVV